MESISLVQTVKTRDAKRAELAEYERQTATRISALKQEIAACETILRRTESGLDVDKIALAETVVYAGDYSRAGDERNSARQDAIKWFATGKNLRGHYGDLRREYFGTKSYDRWHGQRCDCEYGMGPTHGSIIFRIGLTADARKRDLTDEEREAAVYYLLNLEAIQAQKVAA